MNLQEICLKVVELCKSTGVFLKTEQSKISSQNVEEKGLHNYVTYVDKTAEKILVEGLQKILPEAGFIVEEETITKHSDNLSWIVDPLDGTTNYIHGLAPYAISIGLMHENKIVAGVIYEPNLDECFYAWQNGGAYLNGKPIHVSKAPKVKDALVATGFPYYDYHLLEQFLESLAYFMQNSHGMRRIGSAATDMAYVAAGRFDVFYEYSLSPWDVAAGVIIVQEAGGIVSDFKGGNDYIFGEEIIASNNLIFNEFLDVVKKLMVEKK